MTSRRDQEQTAVEPVGNDEAPASDAATPPRSVQDDPRARNALERKRHAASPTAATGAGHVKAAHESARQGKQEKKVRW
ncbi:hypothetical protein E8P82_12710 [Arthrobacter echini]|uniref:DUF5302 domain-containing protein n=1 Tax=Arthrobacter echini TaxID=1529066 RepID=A0A4S5E1D9_9MICC|nr:hypothetical protein [Arthrobacter echini]THJ65168.1 hypothetical protein E8P82_12710 [Arthrobacter echini]